MKNIDVYGIGNPLIDILVNVEETDLDDQCLAKGTMHLIDVEERKKLISFIKNKNATFLCGGSAPNTLIALSSLGLKTVVTGKVGNDAEGLEYKRQLSNFTAISGLSEGTLATGSSIILITPDAERTMNTFLGANREFTEEDIDFSLLAKSKYFYFTGYMWDTESQKTAILKCIEFCNKNGIKILFDLADPFAVNWNREEFLELIKEHVHTVFANREESKILFGQGSVEDCAKKLSSIVDIGIIKDGSSGSIIQAGDATIKIPVNKVNAIDSTGAGDMYAAGFIYGLVNNFDLESCGMLSSWIASQIVIKYGAQFNDKEFRSIKNKISNGNWRFAQE